MVESAYQCPVAPRLLRRATGAALLAGVVAGAGCEPAPSFVSDEQLRAEISAAGIDVLDFGATQSQPLVELGRLLFFDKLLSGNKDIACATCHHPAHHTGDALSLSIGTGGHGLGLQRERGPRQGFIPRNAPELFNRGAPLWRTMFWDSRVAGRPYELTSPAGTGLPPGLNGALAAQAMFPPTSPDEMRGAPGDQAADGTKNELGAFAGEELGAIWSALAGRLRAVPEYRALFAEAFPDVAPQQIAFQHAANAIAAFEVDAFTFTNSPWDRYLTGDDSALSPQQKRGAQVFLGAGRCVVCHAGPLLTDQEHHNLCTPQLGPGKGQEAPMDFGRGRETSQVAERYAFRTPPLRNVELTGPWMHDGAYNSLEATVRHHLDPVASLRRYDRQTVDPRLRASVINDERFIAEVIQTPASALEGVLLGEQQIEDLLAFLAALTDPAALEMSDLVPASVPSGLPVDRP